MFTKFALRSILVLCVIVLLSTAMVGSAVTAQEIVNNNPILTASPQQTIQGGSPVPGGPGFIAIGAFAFKPYDSTSILGYANTWLYNNGSIPGAYMAPVNLPHGATITKVVCFYYDTTEVGNISLYLFRVNMFDGSASEVANAFPLASSGYGHIEADIYEPLVNNQLYSYVIQVWIANGFHENLSLINVRIDYDYPVYLPTVQK